MSADCTGSAVGVASAAIAGSVSAQSNIVINDPTVVREIEEQFAGYDAALMKNDLAALNGSFFDSATTVRYGNAENLYGFSEIQAYRSAVPTGAQTTFQAIPIGGWSVQIFGLRLTDYERANR
ncbi:MAG: hypothetical protein QOF19_2720 [Alphaproteobacteria bacterium]|jgi:hypothetical protein|nr:hypothetical protein [Alphaproteobacteria bacterium]